MLKILLIKQSYQIQYIFSKQDLNFFPIKESSQIIIIPTAIRQMSNPAQKIISQRR